MGEHPEPAGPHGVDHPGGDIWLPSLEKGEMLDWEVELTAVIGRECRNVSRVDALDYVLGHTRPLLK